MELGVEIFISWDLNQIKLRGFLSHIRQICIGYWGVYPLKAQPVLLYALSSPRPHDAANEEQAPAEATGRSWVQSMFSRDPSLRSNSFSRVRKWTSDSGSIGNKSPRFIVVLF